MPVSVLASALGSAESESEHPLAQAVLEWCLAHCDVEPSPSTAPSTTAAAAAHALPALPVSVPASAAAAGRSDLTVTAGLPRQKSLEGPLPSGGASPPRSFRKRSASGGEGIFGAAPTASGAVPRRVSVTSGQHAAVARSVFAKAQVRRTLALIRCLACAAEA